MLFSIFVFYLFNEFDSKICSYCFLLPVTMRWEKLFSLFLSGFNWKSFFVIVILLSKHLFLYIFLYVTKLYCSFFLSTPSAKKKPRKQIDGNYSEILIGIFFFSCRYVAEFQALCCCYHYIDNFLILLLFILNEKIVNMKDWRQDTLYNFTHVMRRNSIPFYSFHHKHFVFHHNKKKQLHSHEKNRTFHQW